MQTEKTNILTIKTPEGITFSLHLAGTISRFIAWAIDVMTISVVMSILQVLLAVFGLVSVDLAYAIAILLYFVVSIGYNIFLNGTGRARRSEKKCCG